MSGLSVTGCAMRALGADETTPLEAFPLNEPGVIAVVVPFGHLVVGEVRSPELIARLGPPTYQAILSQGPGRDSLRDVLVFDDRLEIELLPSKAVREWHPPQKREERLVVIVPREA